MTELEMLAQEHAVQIVDIALGLLQLFKFCEKALEAEAAFHAA